MESSTDLISANEQNEKKINAKTRLSIEMCAIQRSAIVFRKKVQIQL